MEHMGDGASIDLDEMKEDVAQPHWPNALIVPLENQK